MTLSRFLRVVSLLLFIVLGIACAVEGQTETAIRESLHYWPAPPTNARQFSQVEVNERACLFVPSPLQYTPCFLKLQQRARGSEAVGNTTCTTV